MPHYATAQPNHDKKRSRHSMSDRFSRLFTRKERYLNIRKKARSGSFMTQPQWLYISPTYGLPKKNKKTSGVFPLVRTSMLAAQSAFFDFFLEPLSTPQKINEDHPRISFLPCVLNNHVKYFFCIQFRDFFL